MPKIKLTTEYDSSIREVFDANRSIDLHEVSAIETNEKAIAGKTSGLIEKGEWVTWRAKHFGFYLKLTVEITKMEPPVYFRDEMKKGIFKRFTHDHYFETVAGKTIMYEVFDYDSPLGVLGKLADTLFLKSYMRRFLETRNKVVKTHLIKGNNF
ncbi:MAG: SRPBCC family protein [Flavobacteriales bacterium]